MKKFYSIILSFIMIFSIFMPAYAEPYNAGTPYDIPDPNMGSLNYVYPYTDTNLTSQYSLTFGGNLFHTRRADESQNKAIFPMMWAWSSNDGKNVVDIGESYSQPTIVGNTVFTLAGNYIYAINLENGLILDKQPMQKLSDPTGSSISYFAGSLYFGTRDGYIEKYTYDSNTNKLNYIWKSSKQAGQRISSTPTFVYDVGSEKEGQAYIIAGSWDGNIYITDANTGLLVASKKMSGPVTGSPISVAAGSDRPSTFILGVDGAGRNIYGGYVENGMLKEETNTASVNDKIDPGPMPASFALQPDVDKNGNARTYVFFSDRNGVFYAYDRNTGELMWKISDYKGSFINNTPTVGAPKTDGGKGYVYYTVSDAGGHAEIVVVDYINGKIVKTLPLQAKSYSGTTLVNAKMYDGTNNVYDVFLSSDQAGKVYAVVDGAEKKDIFLDIDALTSGQGEQYKSELDISKVGSPKRLDYQHPEISFSQGYMFVTYNGVLQAYKPFDYNNLAITELTLTDTSGHAVSGFEPDKKYTVTGNMMPILRDQNIIDANIPVRLYVNGKLADTKEIKGGYEGPVTFDYTPPAGVDKLTIRMVINEDKNPAESIPDYDNYQKGPVNNLITSDQAYADNEKTIEVTMAGMDVDLWARDLESPSPLKPKTYSTASVTVGNDSDKDIDTWVQFKVNDVSQGPEHIVKVSLKAHESRILNFKWKTPPNTDFETGRTVNLSAEINPDRSIPEIEYTNNKAETNVKIEYSPNHPIPNECDTWIEQRKDHYVEPKYDEEGNKIKDGHWVYKDVTFENCLIVDAKIITDHDPYRSGYGFYLEVNTNVDTNYDKPEDLVGAQEVIAYFEDGGVVKLEPKYSTSKLDNVWVLPQNPESIYNNRKYFTDPHQPDGEFKVEVYATGAGHGNKLVAKDEDSVKIVGSMYDDDATVIAE